MPEICVCELPSIAPADGITCCAEVTVLLMDRLMSHQHWAHFGDENVEVDPMRLQGDRSLNCPIGPSTEGAVWIEKVSAVNLSKPSIGMRRISCWYFTQFEFCDQYARARHLQI